MAYTPARRRGGVYCGGTDSRSALPSGSRQAIGRHCVCGANVLLVISRSKRTSNSHVFSRVFQTPNISALSESQIGRKQPLGSVLKRHEPNFCTMWYTEHATTNTPAMRASPVIASEAKQSHSRFQTSLFRLLRPDCVGTRNDVDEGPPPRVRGLK